MVKIFTRPLTGGSGLGRVDNLIILWSIEGVDADVFRGDQEFIFEIARVG
jgi:hypothetical protein